MTDPIAADGYLNLTALDLSFLGFQKRQMAKKEVPRLPDLVAGTDCDYNKAELGDRQRT